MRMLDDADTYGRGGTVVAGGGGALGRGACCYDLLVRGLWLVLVRVG